MVDSRERKTDPIDLANRIITICGNESGVGSSFSFKQDLETRKIDNFEDVDPEAFNFVVRELERQGLLADVAVYGDRARVKLTFQGWKAYHELVSGKAPGTTAFLAHQFGDPEIRSAMGEFGEVCGRCGYTPVDLERVEHFKAGGINHRIELEIKLSKFVIADLTMNNNGAYWEAGFAAGLGRKVIYTCRKDFFESAKTHFDVNHHMTILWQPDNLSEAAENLEACIRNTFTE